MLQARKKKKENFDSLSSVLSSEQRGTREESQKKADEGDSHEEPQKDEGEEARKDDESASDDLY